MRRCGVAPRREVRAPTRRRWSPRGKWRGPEPSPHAALSRPLANTTRYPTMKTLRWGLPVAAALGTVLYCCVYPGVGRAPAPASTAVAATTAQAAVAPPVALEPVVEKALGWLAE